MGTANHAEFAAEVGLIEKYHRIIPFSQDLLAGVGQGSQDFRRIEPS